jgi:hypothetical protein
MLIWELKQASRRPTVTAPIVISEDTCGTTTVPGSTFVVQAAFGDIPRQTDQVPARINDSIVMSAPN